MFTSRYSLHKEELHALEQCSSPTNTFVNNGSHVADEFDSRLKRDALAKAQAVSSHYLVTRPYYLGAQMILPVVESWNCREVVVEEVGGADAWLKSGKSRLHVDGRTSGAIGT